MPYTPTDWIDGVTPTNAANLDKLENGLATAAGVADTALARTPPPPANPGDNGKWLQASSGAMVWTTLPKTWVIFFPPLSNEPPFASFATYDVRNNHPVLDFDAAANEIARFSGILPPSYLGGSVQARLIWAATTATTGSVRWNAAIERIAAGAQDLDSDSFGSVSTANGNADSVSGETTETAISLGANPDGLVAGEMFRLSVTRDAAHVSDTMAGDAELVMVVLSEV